MRAPAGEPVAKMRVDYTSEDDTGVFSQLATMDRLHGLGIATMLIAAAEQRVRAQGLTFAALGVEDDNPRARRLYERLGYQASGRRAASWEYQDDHGVPAAVRNHAHDAAEAPVTPALTTPRVAVNSSRDPVLFRVPARRRPEPGRPITLRDAPRRWALVHLTVDALASGDA